MNDLINLVYSKIIAGLPSIADSEAAFYRMQIIILLRILQSKGVQRILATPDEIQQLTALGKKLDHDVDERVMIVRPETYKNWLRRLKRKDEIKRPGRKRSIAQSVIDVVVRLIKENPGWGWLRIAGEMKKLGVTIAASTIARICKSNDLPMPPRKNKKSLPISTWSQFIKCNMETIVATDFFSKTIYTWKGIFRGEFQAYSMVFIHYASRKVFVSPPTYNPDTEWVQQQARNVAMWLEDEGIKLRFMIHDSDTKYTAKFKEFFQKIIDDNWAEEIDGKKKEGNVIKTAVRCPPQNGYAETWIGHLKAECLNVFPCFSLFQFGKIIARYQDFYNNCRPHQNKGNMVLGADFAYPKNFDASKVRCKKSLGGLLKHYYIEDENDIEQAA